MQRSDDSADLEDVLVDLLFPPCCVGCGVLLGRASAGCVVCRACSIALAPLPQGDRVVDGIEALWAYQGPLASALHRLKYCGEPALAGPLGRLLASAETLVARDRSGTRWDAVVPVPLAPLRAWGRGYNQATLIARWAARARPGSPPVRAGLLARRRAGPPQSALPRARRLENVRGAFVARRPRRVAGLRILVVDDVTTTGATLDACRTALVAAGAREVGALALLRTLA